MSSTGNSGTGPRTILPWPPRFWRFKRARKRTPEIKEALFSAAGRLTALSKAHEKLEIGEAGPNAQMREYLEALCQALSESNKPGNAVSLELSCSEIELPLSRAIPVGLIANELVTLSLIHISEQGSTGSVMVCLLYTSPSPRDRTRSRMPSSA